MKALVSMLLISVLASMVGCSSTSPDNIWGSTIEKSGGKRVTTTVSSTNILAMTPMSLETAESATADLQHQCNGGRVVNLTALRRTTFLLVVNIERLDVSGYCE